MQPQNHDRLKGAERMGAVIGASRMHAEGARAAGRYLVKHSGPVEHLRKEYIDMRNARDDFRSRGMHYTANIIEYQMERIPQEIKGQVEAPNLVTTVGGNHMLDSYLAGSSYTATWFILLIGSASYTTGPALGDTSASHAGWTEATGYSNANRPTTAWSAAAAKSKTLASGAVFNMNASATIKGCGLISNSTKGGTTGTLFSAGLFTGGDQPVVDGNTLTVNYTLGV